MPPWPEKPRARMIQPPTTAPTIPITMSIRGPYPEPRIILPVAQPAINPTMIHQSKCISTFRSLQDLFLPFMRSFASSPLLSRFVPCPHHPQFQYEALRGELDLTLAWCPALRA